MPVDEMASGIQGYPEPVKGKRQEICPLGQSDGPVSTADLPTLTTGIVTPSGSSCVSTFTQTACAPGNGGM